MSIEQIISRLKAGAARLRGMLVYGWRRAASTIPSGFLAARFPALQRLASQFLASRPAVAATISLFVIVLIWLGFGWPQLAEKRVRQAMDTWIAGGQAEGTRYEGVRLDFWGGRLTFDALTRTLRLDAPGASGAAEEVTVTVRDLAFEGFSTDGLTRAFGGVAGESLYLADRISWSGLVVADKNQVTLVRAGPGFIGELSIESTELSRLASLDGVSFEAFQQGVIRLGQGGSVGGVQLSIAALGATAFSGRGFQTLTTGPVRISLLGIKQNMQAEWRSFAAKDFRQGEPIRLGSLEHEGFSFRINPVSSNGAQDLVVRFAVGRYGFSGMRVDPRTPDFYRLAFHWLSDTQWRNHDATMAALTEKVLQWSERSLKLQTGIESFVLEDLTLLIPALQSLAIERFEVRGFHGLEIDRAEITGHRRKDVAGSAVSLQSGVLTGADFSNLPVWLRGVLGSPVRPESFDALRDFMRRSAADKTMPVLDFGGWEGIGLSSRNYRGQGLDVDRLMVNSLRTGKNGDIELDLSLTGLSAELQGVTAIGANARLGLGLMTLRDRSTRKFDFDFALSFSAARKRLDLQRLRLDALGLAGIAADGAAVGLDVSKFRRDAGGGGGGGLAPVLSDAAITDLRISLTDLGGRETLFNLLAADSGKDPAVVVQDMSSNFRAAFSGMSSKPAKAIMEAGDAFIREGGVLRINASPDTPAPLMRLIDMTGKRDLPGAMDLLQIESGQRPPG